VTAILAYHQLDRRPGLGISCVSTAAFERHLDYLLAEGWRGVSLNAVQAGPATEKRFAITFDDGFALQLKRALPILQRRDLTAHAFVVTDYVGKPALWDYSGRSRRHAGWDLLRQWLAAGMSVGSHGRSHRDLRRLADVDLAAELRDSRATLMQHLQCAVDAVSYPFGRHDARVVAAAGQAGYRLGVTVRPGTAHAESLRLPRLVVSRLDTEISVGQRLRPTLWGSLERTKQRIISAWAGGTVGYQALRRRAA
jgi:peptidoglycan/xylan/chitin deacetylase (PgdA/CDA1 family)